MVKKILVPFDGSKTAKKALTFAVDLAKQAGAEITLLCVIEEKAHVALSVPASATPTHVAEPLEDYLKQAGEAIIDEAAAFCESEGVQPGKVMAYGDPVEEIVKTAGHSGADLIVIGSHGRGALEAAFLGSVTYGLIHRDTKYPVLVVGRDKN